MTSFSNFKERELIELASSVTSAKMERVELEELVKELAYRYSKLSVVVSRF